MTDSLSSVPSRQRTEATRIALPVTGALGAGATAESRPVRSTGYNAVVGLVVSDVPGTVTILAAPERRVGARNRPGTFIPIKVIPTTLQGGVQAAQVDEEVVGDFIKVLYTNGPTKQADFQFSVYLVPVFAFKRVDATISGGVAIGAVELKDSATDTEASIQVDGAPIPPGADGGALLISGKDPTGRQVVVSVTAAGVVNVVTAPGAAFELKDSATDTEASIQVDGAPIPAGLDGGGLLISGRDPTGRQVLVSVTPAGVVKVVEAPGATVTTSPDAVVGIGATVALAVPPAGTLAETVQNTGTNPATVVRVREAGGPAGAGDKLVQNGTAYFTKAVAPLAVEEVAGIATSVSIMFEGP